MEETLKKNVLLLVPTFADEGGTQKMVCELGKLLAEKYTVFECSFNAYNERRVFQNDNKVLSLEVSDVNGVAGKLTGYFKKVAKLRRLKKQYSIDVTISNLWGADLVNAFSFHHDKGLAIAHINIVGNYQNRLLYRMRRLGAKVYGRMAKVVAVSSDLKKEWVSVFQLASEKVTYINNFISFPAHLPAPAPKPVSYKRLVTMGRLNPIKNQEPLLEVLSQLKAEARPVQLVFLGEGPLKSGLLEKAAQLGLSVSNSISDPADLVFAGFVPNPYSILVSSDLFVFPSRSEGLPLVLAEAMHAGLPIVTSDCPTGPHMILEGKGAWQAARTVPEETPYGFLMPVPEPAEDVRSWKQVITTLLENEEKMATMAASCRIRALDFSKEKIKADWFALIDSL